MYRSQYNHIPMSTFSTNDNTFYSLVYLMPVGPIVSSLLVSVFLIFQELSANIFFSPQTCSTQPNCMLCSISIGHFELELLLS
jgi:hypothetical protein